MRHFGPRNELKTTAPIARNQIPKSATASSKSHPQRPDLKAAVPVPPQPTIVPPTIPAIAPHPVPPSTTSLFEADIWVENTGIRTAIKPKLSIEASEREIELEYTSFKTVPAGWQHLVTVQDMPSPAGLPNVHIVEINEIQPGQSIILKYIARSALYFPTLQFTVKATTEDYRELLHPTSRVVPATGLSGPTFEDNTKDSILRRYDGKTGDQHPDSDRQNTSAALEYLRETMNRYQNAIEVYTDADAAGNHFASRGEFDALLGDLVAPLDEISTNASGFGTDRLTTFDPRNLAWGGWYFLDGVLPPTVRQPIANWGDQTNTGYDLTSATMLRFWAKGSAGGEAVQFSVGNTAAPFQPYPARPADPRLPVSYQTVKAMSSFDIVLRNAAYVYDNSVALIALLGQGDTARAQSIASALLHAQANDRFFTDGHLRNAYQGGDIALPPGWVPNRKANTVRMPGWYDPSHATWYEDETQVSSNTENIAWAALALRDMWETTKNSQYLTAAESPGGWVIANASEQRGGQAGSLGGFTGGYDGWENGADSASDATCSSPAIVIGQCKRLYKSTEHNIDLYSVYSRLVLVDATSKRASAAQPSLGYGFKQNGGNTSARSVTVEVLDNGGADLRVQTVIRDVNHDGKADQADVDIVRRPSESPPLVNARVLASGGGKLSIRIRVR
jgi:hypothetical protein